MEQRKLPIIEGDTEGNPRMFSILSAKIKKKDVFCFHLSVNMV